MEKVERVAHFKKIANGESKASDEYKGIPIFAHKGLHQHAFDFMVASGILEGDIKILELACGAGAMTQRLSDIGKSVLALDALPENFKAKGNTIESRFSDLNKDFSAPYKGQFDLIVAMEIIEHLESPRAFLRSCSECLKPNGVLFLTMPNVDSSFSITSLALKNCFHRFNDLYLKNDGHIMPITRHQFLEASKDVGFRLEGENACGNDKMPLK